jgi:pimeloyl-ACP methyl ester carboxylesterase
MSIRGWIGCCLSLGFLVAPGAAQANGSGDPPCAELTFRVALAPGQPAQYRLKGWLCSPPPLDRRTLQILVHGATYGHVYWVFPYRPSLYSYARAANERGYATLNIDRLGSGESDHPPPEIVTCTAHSYVLHQIIQTVRSGALVAPRLGRVRAERIILVGHSLGSAIAAQEAAQYQDVNGVIITGLLHALNPDIIPMFQAAEYPAQEDPRFAGLNLPLGYSTTRPGTRGSLFYYLPNAEPVVIALDEATKETNTNGEASDFFNALSSTLGIRAPALVVSGDRDIFACAPPLSCTEAGAFTAEAQYYSPEACLETFAVPGAGHSINLQRNAPLWFDRALDWADRRVGRSSRHPARHPCP